MTQSLPSLRTHHAPTELALARQLADDIVARLNDAIGQRGKALLCVSGGRSPITLFEALSRTPLDWARVTVSLVDERCVPLTHADSNAGLVMRHLLTGHAAPAQFIGLVPAEMSVESGGEQKRAEQQSAKSQDAEPKDAKLQGAKPQDAEPLAADGLLSDRWVREAEARLRPLWPADVAVLGMGPDGHTASIFPGVSNFAALADPHATPLCATVQPLDAPHRRITLTLSALLAVRHLALQISGAAKVDVYQRACRAKTPDMPISFLLTQPGISLDVWVGPG